MTTYHGNRKIEVKAQIEYPIKSPTSYLISNGKQSWHVPQSLVTIKDDETLIMPQWFAVKKGIPIANG